MLEMHGAPACITCIVRWAPQPRPQPQQPQPSATTTICNNNNNNSHSQSHSHNHHLPPTSGGPLAGCRASALKLHIYIYYTLVTLVSYLLDCKLPNRYEHCCQLLNTTGSIVAFEDLHLHHKLCTSTTLSAAPPHVLETRLCCNQRSLSTLDSRLTL